MIATSPPPPNPDDTLRTLTFADRVCPLCALDEIHSAHVANDAETHKPDGGEMDLGFEGDGR